jgi:hypothetical protein
MATGIGQQKPDSLDHPCVVARDIVQALPLAELYLECREALQQTSAVEPAGVDRPQARSPHHSPTCDFAASTAE